MTVKELKVPGILLLSGAILPLALAPFSLWPLAVLSLLPLFIYLQNQSTKQVLKYALCYGFGLYIAGASWVYISMYEHGGISMGLAVLQTVMFCLFMACLFALPFALVVLIPQTATSWLLGLPALWVLGEWFRGWILTGFPWLYLGYSQTDTWLSGWAPIGGVLLLSYFTAFGGVMMAQLLQRRNSIPLLLSGIAVVFAFVGGFFLQTISWTQATNTQLSVAMVQPDVDQKDKWAVPERDKVLRGLISQTEPYWGTDIIIWPEGAIPALSSQVKQFLYQLDQHADQNGTALITGIPTDNNPAKNFYNSMLVLGDGRGQYNKTRLVPFGEYVPFQSLIRGLNSFFDLPMSSFSLGTKNQLPLVAKQQPIATAICYEIAYPDLVAKNVHNTNLILTVSNDAWFGNSIAPQQHMQMARMRAIENAKPMIRGTNNGITALVDERGKIYQQLPQFEKGVLTGYITPRTGSTPFSRLASWPIVGLSLLVLLILISIKMRRLSKIDKR